MNKIVFFNALGKDSEIFHVSDMPHVPRKEEHVFYNSKEYIVEGVVHNYDTGLIEIYIKRLNSSYVTYKS